MNKKIIKRILGETNYILETGETVREIAQVFHVSKSTVHQDLSERLKEIDLPKYHQVMKVLKYHLNVRHLRGGEATRRKYTSKKCQ